MAIFDDDLMREYGFETPSVSAKESTEISGKPLSAEGIIAECSEDEETQTCDRSEEEVQILRNLIQGYDKSRKEAATGDFWYASLVLEVSDPSIQFSLWLGDVGDALNTEALRSRGITAIVNVALGDCHSWMAQPRSKRPSSMQSDAGFSKAWYVEQLGCPDFGYLAIAADDENDYPLHQHFDETSDFLKRCKAAGRSVLLHCMNGENRSAAVCAAFLMDEGTGYCTEGLTVREAIEWISSRRPKILRNGSFLKKLIKKGECKVWIGGLPDNGKIDKAMNKALMEHMKHGGDCKYAEIRKGGVGVAVYKSADEAQSAVMTLAGSMFEGHYLQLDAWENKPKRR